MFSRIRTLYLNPTMLLLACLGFASGLPLALTFSTLTVWLADVGVSKSTIGLFAAVGLPYSLKFLWSHMVDHLPLPWLSNLLGRRRSWLILTQFLLMGALIGLGQSHPAEDAMMTAILALLVAWLSASQDIVADAYRVEILPKEEQGAASAVFVFGYRVGMLVSGAGALLIAEYTGSNWLLVYGVMAAFMLVGVGAVLCADEPQDYRVVDEDEKGIGRFERIKAALIAVLMGGVGYGFFEYASPLKTLLPFFGFSIGEILYGLVLMCLSFFLIGYMIMALSGVSLKKTVLDPFVDFMQRPVWKLILAFVLFYKFGELFAGNMTNPFLIDIGFSKADIAWVVKIFGFIATILGAFVGGFLVKRMGIMPALWVGAVVQMLSNLMFVLQAEIGALVSMLAVTISVENISGGIGTAAFVAYLSSLCNREYTATQYALLSSLMVASRSVLVTFIFGVDKYYYGDGSFIDVIGWSWFFVITTLAAVPGLLFLGWLQYATRKLR